MNARGSTSTAQRRLTGQAKSTALLEPLADAIGRHVLAGQAIFADDTPVKMLAPGSGKTATAQLWAYGRDERPWGSDAPPASWYRLSPNRKGQHPKGHLSGYRGWIHADGYAGFEDTCWPRQEVTKSFKAIVDVGSTKAAL